VSSFSDFSDFDFSKWDFSNLHPDEEIKFVPCPPYGLEDYLLEAYWSWIKLKEDKRDTLEVVLTDLLAELVERGWKIDPPGGSTSDKTDCWAVAHQLVGGLSSLLQMRCNNAPKCAKEAMERFWDARVADYLQNNPDVSIRELQQGVAIPPDEDQSGHCPSVGYLQKLPSWISEMSRRAGARAVEAVETARAAERRREDTAASDAADDPTRFIELWEDVCAKADSETREKIQRLERQQQEALLESLGNLDWLELYTPKEGKKLIGLSINTWLKDNT
jgi:hypothetical protein